MLARVRCRGQLLPLTTLFKRLTSTTSNAATDADAKKSATPEKGKKRWPLPPTNEDRLRKMREDFLRREAECEALVDFGKLTDDEKVIHRRHKQAAEGNLTRSNPTNS